MPPVDQMSDEEKLMVVRELVRAMSAPFKDHLLDELDPPSASMEKLQIHISSNADAQLVRVELSKRVRWIILSTETTTRLAMLLLEHSGAKLEKRE